MKTTGVSFSIRDKNSFKIKMLNWASRFNIFCFLDTNNYSFESPAFEALLAVNDVASVTLSADSLFSKLNDFRKDNLGWLFGHISYPSGNKNYQRPDSIGFPDGFFFKPGITVMLLQESVVIESVNIDPAAILKEINSQPTFIVNTSSCNLSIENGYSREEYIQIIEALRTHIKRGDCYEINFCMDFLSQNTTIDPLYIYSQLQTVSPNPFGALYKLHSKFCICASPERFITKKGNTVVSQPIKGTSKRDHSDSVIDENNKQHLLKSEKEKSENVMIVDLVRNDLSKICTEGSVTVKELFGIYSFPQVHQMISTIEGIVNAETPISSVIEACFPMGSMTGAPKARVMELIDQYEEAPRGLFSGSIGYITPDNDFDFNVVIRSLFYNDENHCVSFKAGSGITFKSDPQLEYEECLMKAAAIIKVLKVD